jgi:hypothetical protein
MRAAGMAIPFEHPKLGVSMNVQMSEEFGQRLERAIARATEAYEPKAIEHQPVEHPPTTKPMTSLPDRRFRRI